MVADEVRNLAMRAAKAAQDTAELIEGTVSKVHEGEELAKKTDENFKKVSEQSAKMGTLINEIAGASDEQNSGLSGVNTALSEIDQVTQQTAANSAQAASASGDLSTQALHLEGYVHELVVLIKGGRQQGTHSFKGESKPEPLPTAHPRDNTTPNAEKMIAFDGDDL